MIDCRNFFIFVFFLCLLFQFVEGFFLFALQRYDGFSHGENIFVLFICASCDKPMELRQMEEKALKSVAKVVFCMLNTRFMYRHGGILLLHS